PGRSEIQVRRAFWDIGASAFSGVEHGGGPFIGSRWANLSARGRGDGADPLFRAECRFKLMRAASERACIEPYRTVRLCGKRPGRPPFPAWRQSVALAIKVNEETFTPRQQAVLTAALDLLVENG